MQQYIEDNIGFIKLVDKNSDPGLRTVNAARISYGTEKQIFDEKDKKLVNFLHTNDHTSPFRHAFYTFHIKAPLSVFRQWMKYQVGSYWRVYETDTPASDNTISVDMIDLLYDTDKGCSWNEISRRYTQPKEEFYLPLKLRSNPSHGNKQSSGEYVNPLDKYDIQNLGSESDIIEHMRNKCTDDLVTYKTLIANGVAREIARDILPVNMYSEAYWTVSLQGIMHFLKQRLGPNAQYEIKMYARCILSLISDDLSKAGIVVE